MSPIELTIMIVLAVLVLILAGERWWNHYIERRTADAARAAAILEALKSLDQLREIPSLLAALQERERGSSERAETLMNGLEAMCKELCRAVDAVTKGLEIQERFLDGNDRPEDEEPGEGMEAAREVRSLIARGIDPAMAEKRVMEKNLYRNLERSR